MIATFSKYAKFIQMPINFEHFMIATFAKYANFIRRRKKNSALCVFGASVMGDLMYLLIEMSQSRVSKYSFHKKFISGQQSQDSCLQFEFLKKKE